MALTSIGSQLTPGRPTEITFAAEQGLPVATQNLVLIGHMNNLAPSGTVAYEPIELANVADRVAASGEAAGYFGAGSELAKMVVAAVKANALNGNFPPITCIPLAQADVDWGGAMDQLDKIPGSVIAGPYDSQNQTLAGELLDEAAAMSAAQRVENDQFGSMAVLANRSVVNPNTLFPYDKQFGSFPWLRDTGTGGDAPALSLGELAASYGAILASNPIPFNPLNGEVVPNVDAPAKRSDWITVGAGLESESCLQKGYVPFRVLPNGDVTIVRARTLRITVGDGVTDVTAYFDAMDFQVLYFWRKTLVTRFKQPDLTQAKASQDSAKLILSEVIRLATAFEDQGMFQSVAQLAKSFVVERNISDRGRFDVFTPVNVIPGLAVIATNIQATTVGDTLSI